jgi:tetratricopeptide (TPR) repeat protein
MQRANTLVSLAFNMQRHDPTRTNDAFEEARNLYNQLGDRFYIASMLRYMAHISLFNGNIEQAFENFREARLLNEDLGNRRVIRDSLSIESICSLRYVGLENARQLRLQNLALAQELGDEQPLAWSLWEMGEIERVSGNLDAARRLYDRSNEIFSQVGESTGRCFFLKGLGDIALAKDEHERARQCFQEALDNAKEIRHDWSMVYCGCGLARAEIAAGQLVAGQKHLSDALRDARLTGFRDLLPFVLTCFAQWHAADGDPERAIVLGNFAANLKTTWLETKGLAQDIVEEAAGSLSDEEVRSAMEKSQKLDVPAAVLIALSADTSPLSP